MIAIDTNVLVYAVNADERGKGELAAALLRGLDPAATILPWQVVCEFGAVLERRNRQGTVGLDARAAVDMWLGMYRLVIPSRTALEIGWSLIRESQLSYWDGMLLGACAEAGVTTLFTEDLQSSPVVRGVRWVNPFA